MEGSVERVADKLYIDIEGVDELGSVNIEHDDVVAAYEEVINDFNELYLGLNTGVFREEYVMFILAISILLVIMIMVRMNRDITGFRFAFNYIILAGLLVAEIGYMIEYDNILWFCVPEDVGWATAAFSLVILCALILLQLFCFMISMIDCADNFQADVSFKIGYNSLLFGILATTICVIFWAEGIVYVIIGVVAAQLIQYTQIIIACAKGRCILFAIPFILLYTLGMLVLLIAIINIVA